MSDSVRLHSRQPTRLPRPWDSPGKNTGVGCHFLLQCMKVKSKVKSLSCVRLLATPWTAAYQAPPSMGFSRQEYWSGVPLPSLSFRVRQGKKCPLSLKIYFLGWQSECSFFSKNFFLLLLRAQSLLHSCQKKSVYWLSTCECEMKILSFKEHVYGGVCCKMLRSMELSNIIVYS